MELRAGLEPAYTRFAGAAVSVPVTATISIEQGVATSFRSARQREPGIQLGEDGFRARRKQPSLRRLRKLACGAPSRNDSSVVVRVGGFEPPVSCFQGRQGRPGSPTPCEISSAPPSSSAASGLTRLARMRARALGHPAGLEPAAFGFARRRSAPLSYGWTELASPAGFEPAPPG